MYQSATGLPHHHFWHRQPAGSHRRRPQRQVQYQENLHHLHAGHLCAQRAVCAEHELQLLPGDLGRLRHCRTVPLLPRPHQADPPGGQRGAAGHHLRLYRVLLRHHQRHRQLHRPGPVCLLLQQVLRRGRTEGRHHRLCRAGRHRRHLPGHLGARPRQEHFHRRGERHQRQDGREGLDQHRHQSPHLAVRHRRVRYLHHVLHPVLLHPLLQQRAGRVRGLHRRPVHLPPVWHPFHRRSRGRLAGRQDQVGLHGGGRLSGRGRDYGHRLHAHACRFQRQHPHRPHSGRRYPDLYGPRLYVRHPL